MQMSAIRSGISAFVLVSLVAGAANAGPTTISDPVFTIVAESTNGTATYNGNYGDGFLDEGIYSWFGTGLNLIDPNNNNVIGVFEQGLVTVVLDPIMGLSYAVRAGAVDTTFTITSPLVSFAPISNATVRASGSLGATNVTGTAAGVSMIGQYPGNLAYLTQYNGYVPGGTTFATQCPPIITSGSSGSGPFQDTGDVLVGGPISNMSLQIKFTLSAGDRANGTVNYSIKPEPATAALLALGLFAATRRR